MTDRDPPADWFADDHPDADREQRRATLALAMTLDRTRKLRRKLAGRWRQTRPKEGDRP